VSAPIRVRLTAWYVVLLAVVLTGLGTFVVTRLRTDLTNAVDAGLRPGAARIAEGYKAEGEKDFRDVARTVLPGPAGRGSGAQVLDARSRVLFWDGDPVTRRPLLTRDDLREAIAGLTVLGSTHRGEPSKHLRVIAVPAERLGERQALVVTESLAGVDRAVHRVLILLLFGGAASLALVALGGWWIARKALKPVERMTTRADDIGIDRLDERIAVPRVNDEVGHLARTLNAMLDRLQEGVEARQRLVADASHELRAPLTAMRSEIEVSLRQDPLNVEARSVLESARGEVLRMGRIVDDLLTLARITEGRLELLVGPQDLRALADEAARSHRAAADAAHVELIAEGGRVAVAGDKDRLNHVLGNLVDNAIKYAPPNTEVRIGVSQDGRGARITVSDEGPGIPPDQRQLIFERFARLDPARSRRGGAGLGLAICAEIVRAHGGRIWVEAHEPRGSTFVVELPLTAAGDGDGRAPVTTRASGA
jgi:two-component system, OmpR family, sensor kinase